jgi:kynurenine formamidase
VQQLCNLDCLVGQESRFICLPIKTPEGTGCPVRTAALVM